MIGVFHAWKWWQYCHCIIIICSFFFHLAVLYILLFILSLSQVRFLLFVKAKVSLSTVLIEWHISGLHTAHTSYNLMLEHVYGPVTTISPVAGLLCAVFSYIYIFSLFRLHVPFNWDWNANLPGTLYIVHFISWFIGHSVVLSLVSIG